MEHLAISNTNVFSYSSKSILEKLSSSGKKFTTGTVVFSTKIGQPVITHNLGFIPSVFFMIAKNVQGEFTFNAEVRPSPGLYGFLYTPLLDFNKYFAGENMTIPAYCASGFIAEWRDNNSNSLYWASGTAGDGVVIVTDTTIKLTYRSAAYPYVPNVEYEWIAIE